MLGRPISEIDSVTIQRFWELLSHYKNLGTQLRRLQELRVLEQIIPGMKHARCLLQFNEYHKYTVDAHCIRTVECVTDLATDNSTLGNLYRELKNKAILHLALLIHDLGKGFVEDHSEVGATHCCRDCRSVEVECTRQGNSDVPGASASVAFQHRFSA